jgi:hypothetical protein
MERKRQVEGSQEMGRSRKRRKRKLRRSKDADLMASVWAQVVVVGMAGRGDVAQ